MRVMTTKQIGGNSLATAEVRIGKRIVLQDSGTSGDDQERPSIATAVPFLSFDTDMSPVGWHAFTIYIFILADKCISKKPLMG